MEKDIKQLTEEEIKIRTNSLGKWVLSNHQIERVFKFKSFEQAMAFVQDVARIAQKENHHPTIYINYDEVTLTLKTHKVKTLTNKDFDLAEHIEELNESKYSE